MAAIFSGLNRQAEWISRLRPGAGKKKGFTLVELLAVVLISGIILAGVYSLFLSQQRTFSAQEQIAEMDQNLRAAMDLMSREIRLAGYRAPGATFSGIATAQPAMIRLLADLNQNGDTLGENEDISYSYDGQSLQVWRNSPSFPVADNITSLSLLYTLEDGSTSSNPGNLAAIRKVTISMTGRTAYPDSSTGQYRTLTLSSDVTLRNAQS